MLECVGAAGNLSFDDIARNLTDDQPQLSKVLSSVRVGAVCRVAEMWLC